MNMKRPQSNQTPSMALIASAMIIAAMILLQMGRPYSSSALAGDAVVGGEGYTVLTVSSGFGKDSRPYEFCYVLDNHDQMLYVYEIPQANDKRIVLRNGTYLPGLFATARGR